MKEGVTVLARTLSPLRARFPPGTRWRNALAKRILSQARTTFLHYPSQSTLSPSPYVARTSGSGCPRHHWLRIMSQADWSLSLSSLAAHVKASTQAHCLHTPISLPPGGCLSAGLWGWLPPVRVDPNRSKVLLPQIKSAALGQRVAPNSATAAAPQPKIGNADQKHGICGRGDSSRHQGGWKQSQTSHQQKLELWAEHEVELREREKDQEP